MNKNFHNKRGHSSLVSLLAGIATGICLGLILKNHAVQLKPLGDIFLNLLFTTVVPLVFFSIASAVSGFTEMKNLGRILGWMMTLYVLTGILASVLMLVAVSFFPPAAEASLAASLPPPLPAGNIGKKIVEAFTVPDFFHLLSKNNMLALITFSLLTGSATLAAGDKAKPFADFLAAGNAVMMKLIGLIMLYAPVGLGAYFAYLVGVMGPELLGSYLRSVLLYYPLSLVYYVAGFSVYAWLAGGRQAFQRFWRHIPEPSLTALGTGSSLAALPANLKAADQIGIPRDISRITLPIGATIHMDGSCLAAILKIAFLFSFFRMDFSGGATFITAVGVALLGGVVMSGITGGGYLAELLIVSFYGFPPEALPLISMIGTLVDPPATMVNSTGDTAAGMLLARILKGKNWHQTFDSAE